MLPTPAAHDLHPLASMSAPLSQLLFGIGTHGDRVQLVEDLVERLRAAAGSGDDRVVVAQLEDTVGDAHRLFRAFDVHHLPVVSGAQVIGIVSATDLLNFYADNQLQDPNEVPLKTIMTADPQVIRKDAPVDELIHTLARSQFRCLPVVNATGELWDLVTTRDLVRFLEMTYR